MAKATKKCGKCGERKGATVFHVGSDTCRACQSGKGTRKPRPEASPDPKLKEIIERQKQRVAEMDADNAIEAAIATLEERRRKIDQAIETLRAVA